MKRHTLCIIASYQANSQQPCQLCGHDSSKTVPLTEIREVMSQMTSTLAEIVGKINELKETNADKTHLLLSDDEECPVQICKTFNDIDELEKKLKSPDHRKRVVS